MFARAKYVREDYYRHIIKGLIGEEIVPFSIFLNSNQYEPILGINLLKRLGAKLHYVLDQSFKKNLPHSPDQAADIDRGSGSGTHIEMMHRADLRQSVLSLI